MSSSSGAGWIAPDLNTALRFKNNAARGGRLENIHVRDMTVGQVAHAAITIDYNYEEGARGAYVPAFDTLTIDRLMVGRCERVLDLQGFATAPIRNIVLRDAAVLHAAKSDIVRHVEALRYDNVRRNGVAVRGQRWATWRRQRMSRDETCIGTRLCTPCGLGRASRSAGQPACRQRARVQLLGIGAVRPPPLNYGK
jgi:hypothetical protein